MIKFFRKIRQQMIKENKVSRYILYAIGEIVLVIIGILIALQINNWNQQKNNEEKLVSFILDYKKELKYNSKDCKSVSKMINNFVIRNRKLLNTKDLKSVPLDSLEIWIVTYTVEIGINTNVIERFNTSQINNFGKYASIVYGMQDYYNYFWKEQMIAHLKYHNDFVDKADVFWQNEQISYEFNLNEDSTSNFQDKSDRKKNLIEIIQSPKFRNILKGDNKRKERMIIRLKRWEEGNEFIIKEIDSTLNLKN